MAIATVEPHTTDVMGMAELNRLIDDEILNTFAVVGRPEDIAPELGRRLFRPFSKSASEAAGSALPGSATPDVGVLGLGQGRLTGCP